MTLALPDPTFWRDRRVLVTGHTGFKGAWLTCWLQRVGAEVMGVSLAEPVTSPSLWEQLALQGLCDVRDDVSQPGPWRAAVTRFAPEVVLHLAAQPLVSVGWREPTRTFAVNVGGTAQVLDLVAQLPSVAATVVVTTDKVYDPQQRPPHREGDPLGGRDPYSASKAAAELVVGAWPAGSPRGTARAGNVIGGGDWAPDRLLPDLVRAWSAGRSVELRNPGGVRPWQHVLEPLRGYLLYAEALAAAASVPAALNLGPSDAQAVAVQDVVELAAQVWRACGHELTQPPWTVADSAAYEETSLLTLDSRLAGEALGWRSVLDWEGAVRMTLAWYDAVDRGAAPADLVHAQLADYEQRVGDAT